LTDPILKSGCKLDVVEIDRDLASLLRKKHPDLNVIESDILKYDISEIESDKPFRIIGNLPYNISTPLLFKLFKRLELIEDMHFMLQFEVVERMTAAHSTSQYGRLSIMSQLYCETTMLFTVPPESFVPQPRVMSAIIRLRPKTHQRNINVTLLQEVLIQAFSMRRKTIRNALKGFLTAEDIESLGLDPKLRPENLSLDDYLSVLGKWTKNRDNRP
jgi:16S rRNA (adenine1518-N6/adenine1519-N6)-dimethyltransferase